MSTQQLTDLWITDKTGKKHFKTTCSTEYQDSEFRNLSRHLMQAMMHPKLYTFLDVDTARIESNDYELKGN